MNYIEAENYIHSLLKFGIKPGLSRIEKLLDLLGNPQKALKFVHIAGTNGKGTTSTELSFILQEAGYRVGLFTSPYVVDFRERIQINNEMIDKDDLASVIEKIKPIVEKMASESEQPTEFEVITAAAFMCFKNQQCDIAVLEVGLGGRFDSTNIIDTPLVSVIVSISLDHTKLLGDTISKIAFEKCGIIKENGITVTNPNQGEKALEVIKNTAKEKHNNLIVGDMSKVKILDEGIYGTNFIYDEEEYHIGFMGMHQVENALSAINAARQIEKVTTENIRNGLNKAFLPARMEIIGQNPLVILDGGHNEGCARALEYALKKHINGKIHAVVGMMEDKDCKKYLSIVLPLCESVITVTPNNPRAISAKDLAKLAKDYCKNVSSSQTPLGAFEKAKEEAGKDDTIIICGSFYLAGEYK